MGIGTARQVREGLAELIRFVNDPATPTSDLRTVLTTNASTVMSESDIGNGGGSRASGGVGVMSESGVGDGGGGRAANASTVMSESGVGDGGGGRAAKGGSASGRKCGCASRPSADITIVQHLSADGTAAFAEVAGGGVIPESVLEEYFCGARIKGVVFSREGLPLWHSHTKRLATKAQMSALRALYGACGGCGADLWICQGHHIKPVSQGGTTDINNMMLLCWACHQKVHHHDWRVMPDGRGLYTIAPPERIRHGPAHAPDPPPAHGPPPQRAARHPGMGSVSGRAELAPGRVDPNARPSAATHQSEPLFTLA